jgi:hypothetical protein
MTSIRTLAFLPVLACLLPAQTSPPPTPNNQEVDHHKLVQLMGFEVTGTRLPPDSIIRLSGLRPGQMVNYDIISQACKRITSTGLVSAVDYAYNVGPGKPGVLLSLKVWDELPLLPARIYPVEDAEPIWRCLQTADPIFTREMPNTEAAIRFYSVNINRCLANAHATDEYAAPTAVCDARGKTSAIAFTIRKKRGRPTTP